mmetsp:Transcript_24572/g.61370  ORF Transcript_24572/g.61370 Transcript_24572/m.61370 type:complete len:89 (-) Transcript_24572:341-607(-)|eukprot:CAMPEP_0174905934 /NCGR_PEP_ID=MMETSP0167-20121228/54895_1 /TAXON_ID=38298 /ORGANISM="Rhodella maculata, Strain CCMP736" /LENGTH=88 /DNA_ID=CAMNT_0016149043 /DNA_START=303 /DNA_END=569 /DNA_ORIENTATION=+
MPGTRTCTIPRLIAELIEMSKTCPADKYDSERAVFLTPMGESVPLVAEIGMKLNELGGTDALLLAVQEVRKVDRGDGKDLEVVFFPGG